MKWEQRPETRQVADYGFCYKWVLRTNPRRPAFATAAIYVSVHTGVPVLAWVLDGRFNYQYVPVAPTLAETFTLLEAAVALEE